MGRPGSGNRWLGNREVMFSAIQLLLRQFAANWRAPTLRRRCRALAIEQFEFRDLLASVTLTPLADNTIFQNNPSFSDGVGPTLFAGVTGSRVNFSPRRALIEFDVAGNVPAGAHIDSVTLRLHDIRNNDGGATNDFGLYRLQHSWGEGTSASSGNGVQATAKDATWDDRFHGPPATAWTNSGGDFNSTPSASTSISGFAPFFVQWSGAQLTADVQAWLDSSSTQFGWLLKATDETTGPSAQEFDSRESSIIANRPTLTINYTLLPVNHQPTLGPINDPPAILENAGSQTISLNGISAGSGESQNLTVTATSSNPALISNINVSYTSPGATGSLSYTPVADRFGSAIITVKVQDDGGNTNGGVDAITRTFTVKVTQVNDPPTLDIITNPQPILENAGLQSINLTGISAGLFETQRLTVTATSSNPTLIPSLNVNYTSPNSAGSLSYTPAADRFGSAVITVKVQDDGGTASGGVDAITRSFTVNVAQINDPPTLDLISDPAPILGNAVQQTINLTGISAGLFENQVLSITAKSSNPSLIPDPTVSYNSPNSAGSLSYAPLIDQTGSAVITITVMDDGGTANGGDDTITRTFNVQVNSSTSVNHAPSFEKGPDKAATEEAGQVSVPGWATAISPGPPDESSQKLNFIVTLLAADTDARFAVNPAIDAAGNLTFTPAPNAHGVAHFSVRLHDNGGTANGGIDTSVAQTFDITIIKPHPWHNTARDEDVNGDGFVAANDALAIVNRINSFDAGPVPANAPFGPNYYDVNNDLFIAANDVLAVINFVNSNPNGEGEAVGAVDARAADGFMQQLDALLLLGPDATAQQRRRA